MEVPFYGVDQILCMFGARREAIGANPYRVRMMCAELCLSVVYLGGDHDEFVKDRPGDLGDRPAPKFRMEWCLLLLLFCLCYVRRTLLTLSPHHFMHYLLVTSVAFRFPARCLASSTRAPLTQAPFES